MLEDVVSLFIPRLFPGYEVSGKGAFRLIRDSDIEVEEEAEDLVRFFERALKQRRRGLGDPPRDRGGHAGDRCALWCSGRSPSPTTRCTSSPACSASTICRSSSRIDRPDLKFEPYTPRFPERIREHGGDCFAAIRQKDMIVHHPYESFDVVVQFLRQAASDPDVVAIKQTLYRTSNDSPIVKALIEAAEAGQVGDGAGRAEGALRRGGQHPLGARPRARRRAGGLRLHRAEDARQALAGGAARGRRRWSSYVHTGTGNYHPITARIYTDLSYFTADPVIARDVARIFNFITGYAPPQDLKRIAVSPHTLRPRILEHIEAEIAHAAAGRPAQIWMKLNALVDREIIDALYRASQAGVDIDLSCAASAACGRRCPASPRTSA